ncbi:CHAT domain-containing protein [Nitrogeniibacter mangrovi]|uniref:CHAT domain-containing protein n=1 Tax=Nitrogeniibacter mangrovi TaxID=2016596 RepID=A0A6C1B8K6_9RHOO|nr:CHAT domain-containing protein [Nitrogeniibacter mangrovi]QID19289.1 CHAT domain-containing protein [Nitrogeniibacter mangrovi]
MNIFLSYASPYRTQADDLCCRLQAVGHAVFFDREDLPAGTSYDDRIRQAIDDADLFIFLIAPEAVADGHYTRTELKLAARKWPTPGWHVLPVMVAPTPLETIPPYLRALTLLQTEGNLAAEVVMEVADRARQASPDTTPAPRAPETTAGSVRYRSIQLRFRQEGAGRYALAVPESPAGALDNAPLALDPAALEQALWTDARPIAGSARRGASPDAPPARLPGDAAARQIGQALYAALSGTAAGQRLEDSLRSIDPQHGDGLRFVIDTTDAPDLACLPWEFLYHPRQDDFLFSDRLKPVVRWLDTDAPPPTLAVEPPLRMLMAVAAPADRPDLAIGEELAHLDAALAELARDGILETTRLEHTTLERLDAALLAHRPHVLHFIGHGDFVGDDGVLVLESDTSPGAADPIAGRRLAVLLRNYRDTLRLVFLNSCLGAATSRHDAFGGVAQSLIRRGIPAVVAMQFPIPDAAAVALSRHFYRYLAAGQPVDAALSSARAFLYARGYPVEWGAPALHMRAPDGRLFDLAAPRPGADAAAPPAPEPVGTTPPIPAPPTAAPARRRALPLLVGALLVLGAIGVGTLWIVSGGRAPGGETSGAEPPPPPIVAPPAPPPAPSPAPVEPPVIEPAPPPPPPTVEPRPGVTASVDAMAAQLSEGQAASAVAVAETALAPGGDPALRAALLGPQRDTLIGPLVQAGVDARDHGDTRLAERIVGLLDQLAPGVGWAAVISDAGSPTAMIEPAAGDTAGDTMTYTVHRGDTLWRIAARFYGDARRWPTLLEHHNANVALGRGGRRIDDPDHIEPGQRVHVPLSPSTGTNALDYHVVRGDTLSGIAWRIYGDARRWPQIVADNPARLGDPDHLRIGQVLVLRPLRVPHRPAIGRDSPPDGRSR